MMFKTLVALITITGLFMASSTEAVQPGNAIAYTNAEAFQKGLPLPRIRRRPTRSFTAAKRQQSPVLRTTTLRFDDVGFNQADGPIPQPYQGINLGCEYGSCGYAMASVYPRWTAHSSPNEMYFYNYGVPTFTSGTPGALLRLKSLYCTQASGTTAPLRLVGSINEETVFTRTLTCTPNGQTGNNDAPTLNTFNNLPLVDRIQVTTTSDDAGWTFDDVTFTTSS